MITLIRAFEYHISIIWKGRSVLDRILFIPENSRNFKFATRHISDDGALGLIERLSRLLVCFRKLVIHQRTGRFVRAGLLSVMAELWSNRGLYPGILRIWDYLKFKEAIPYTMKQASQNEDELKNSLFSFLNADIDTLPGLAIPDNRLKALRKRWKYLEKTQKELLQDVLPRFDLTTRQIEKIIEKQQMCIAAASTEPVPYCYSRLVRSVDEVRSRLESVRRDDDEYTRTYRLLEDGRRQDAKRLTDLQGDVAVLRKQSDSQRGQTEVLSSGLRKVETRLNELVTVEVERRETMQAFLDKQALSQVERERVWKDWQSRFEVIEKQATDTEKQMVMLETTHREAKRAQVVLEELNQRVERRINEITEVQRLAEDRFRQEWVTFKADDQKRWTSYTLTQEEQRNEATRQFDRMADQVTQLGDSLQETHDMLQQVNELTEKRLQSLLAVVHDWVSSFERTVGRTR